MLITATTKNLPSLLMFTFPTNKARESIIYDDCLVNLAPSNDSLTDIFPD